ncbi:uncharacterized protein LOC130649231 [Hydractinia symbiolongicarpus]|uniref:uncharacterized protein LOC130649231 n=1 Tax=Hydractinia symbiolongicarpus TaxID=13093 RepID=UPI00254E88FF|nr:uncharacterized protein LOC130649231 [Hydractinia symbiolongicarpus]
MTAPGELIVIGAGLPRNGTHTTKTALEVLLPGKCHHMYPIIEKHQAEWKCILNDGMSDEEFKSFFLSNGYIAAVDAPVTFFYERMMKVFPNAKVILNVREPKSWERSMNKTVYPLLTKGFLFPDDAFEMLGWFKSYLIYRREFYRVLMKHPRVSEMIASVSCGNGVEYYNKWVEEVKRNVSEEKLLVFSVKEGWKPLCKFLNVPIPSQPFPHSNDSKAFEERIALNHKRSMLLMYELITIPMAIWMFSKLCWKK